MNNRKHGEHHTNAVNKHDHGYLTNTIRKLLEEYPNNQASAREIYDWLNAENKLRAYTTLATIASLLPIMERAGYIARISRGQYAAASNHIVTEKHAEKTARYTDSDGTGYTVHN